MGTLPGDRELAFNKGTKPPAPLLLGLRLRTWPPGPPPLATPKPVAYPLSLLPRAATPLAGHQKPARPSTKLGSAFYFPRALATRCHMWALPQTPQESMAPGNLSNTWHQQLSVKTWGQRLTLLPTGVLNPRRSRQRRDRADRSPQGRSSTPPQSRTLMPWNSAKSPVCVPNTAIRAHCDQLQAVPLQGASLTSPKPHGQGSR